MQVVDENSMEVVAILDMSGSMEPLTDATIAGFNVYVEGLAQIQKDVFITLITFNSASKVVWEHKNVKQCPKISREEYMPNNGTALTDALGTAITNMKALVSQQQSKPGKVSFFVTTDGQENESTKFTQKQVKEMIVRQTDEEKWEFIFAGANIDAFATSNNYGIQQNNTVQIGNDRQSTRNYYTSMSMRYNMSEKDQMTTSIQHIYNTTS